jgi:hypothetical protein
MALRWVLGVGPPKCVGDQSQPMHECTAIMGVVMHGRAQFWKTGAHMCAVVFLTVVHKCATV